MQYNCFRTKFEQSNIMLMGLYTVYYAVKLRQIHFPAENEVIELFTPVRYRTFCPAHQYTDVSVAESALRQ